MPTVSGSTGDSSGWTVVSRAVFSLGWVSSEPAAAPQYRFRCPGSAWVKLVAFLRSEQEGGRWGYRRRRRASAIRGDLRLPHGSYQNNRPGSKQQNETPDHWPHSLHVVTSDFKRFRPFKRFRRRAARAIVDRIDVSSQFLRPSATEKLLGRTKANFCKGFIKRPFMSRDFQNVSPTTRIGQTPIRSLHLFGCRLHLLI